MSIEARFLLDTNICIYLLDGGNEAVLGRIAACDEGTVVTSAIVFAEVMIGAARRNSIDMATAFFKAIPPQPFDTGAGNAYARLPFQRGSLDRLIAAHAIALDLVLVTNDTRDFANIPDLRLENWTR